MVYFFVDNYDKWMYIEHTKRKGRLLMLRDKRLEKKMTMDELSRISGVSRVSINRYELGTRTPDIVAASKLAAALGCKIEDLMPFAGRGVKTRPEA